MKLITLNIEGHKHLDLVTQMIATEQPDVLCLQEVFESDLSRLRLAFDQPDQFVVVFSANADVVKENQYGIDPMGHWGVAIIVNRVLVKDERTDFHRLFYFGGEQSVPEFTGPYSPRRSLLVGQLVVGELSLAVATTHFTWTPNGQSSPQQHRDIRQLRALLGRYNNCVFCGDFNAPRGREIYSQIVEGLVDHLPSTVITTLDHTFHYAGVLNLVVDGVLSTPDISSIRTELIDGVSDHKAILVEFAL